VGCTSTRWPARLAANVSPDALPILKSVLLGFGFTFIGMTPLRVAMRKIGWGQPIREEGPADHKKKSGTPTMGGGLFVPAGILAAGLVNPYWSWDLVVLAVLVMGCWALGLTDDLTKVFQNRNLGLKARHKLIIQTILGLGLGLYAAMRMPHAYLGDWLIGALPVIGLSWLVCTATTNAVNLTDGQDGLAAGSVLCSLVAYVAIALDQGRLDLALGAAGLAGATFAFLWFNCYPARIFMGDTGSMGLGAALAALAVLTDTEFLFILIGWVFVVEAASVILQVGYFKMTKGKRLFRMSPIHHHFCLGGLHEVQVTTRFWMASAICALAGCYIYFSGGHP
jgi:phospho-N-acetylmuramoyl-pentapeptide-transferase